LTQEEFKELFDAHFDAIRNYVYYRSGNPDLATDIAQDTFMRLWEKKSLEKTDNIKSLLYKIAGDLFVSSYRRQKLAANFFIKQNHQSHNQEETPEDQLQYKELNQRYKTALRRMPEKQRTVFLMSRMDELKYHEIASNLGLSVKAVEKRMKNALAFLKKMMEN
jgi:RNA polymerase sigma-70 factor (family 1)